MIKKFWKQSSQMKSTYLSLFLRKNGQNDSGKIVMPLKTLDQVFVGISLELI